jgi:hypothetical protein
VTAQKWREHAREARGAEPEHDYGTCMLCQARLKTIKANIRARAIRSAYADLGMVRVRGSLGGIYYE